MGQLVVASSSDGSFLFGMGREKTLEYGLNSKALLEFIGKGPWKIQNRGIQKKPPQRHVGNGQQEEVRVAATYKYHLTMFFFNYKPQKYG